MVTSSFRTAITDSATTLKNEGMEDKSAVNAFLLAKFYERNGLQSLALKQYEAAYKLSSGAEEFASEYARCLLDQNYTADAERVLASVK
ncbi:MAG: hypothetical protein HYV28_16620 [Ignavibacteriales bacterium]|nr:hypothetical protein [Ignavibacteriales bacterium]